MTERLAVSAKGQIIAYCGEKALHSRYDPQGEAKKYLDSLGLKGACFMLIEPGLGYLIPFIRESFPDAKIVILHASVFLAEKQQELFPGEAVWHTGRDMSLSLFLEREIPDLSAASVKIIEWRPSLAAYGETYVTLLREGAEFIKRIDANYRTARGFGRRWFRNFFRNIGRTAIIAEFDGKRPRSRRPWVITGAGPGLEESAGEIRRLAGTEGAGVLAAASSVPALIKRGIAPDMVISTDGGNWALLHLYETARGAGVLPGFSPVLATAVWAALPSQVADFPLLPLSDGSLWQELVLEGLGIPHLKLPQRGTVTASALDLALALTAGEIIFTGMDLSQRDIRTHAKPYSFDRLQEEGAARLCPRYAQSFARAGNITSSGSQEIYAAWFRNQLSSYPKRLRSLGKNHPVFSELEENTLGKTEIPGNGGGREQIPEQGFRDSLIFRKIRLPREPEKNGAALLLGALENTGTGKEIYRELAPLLLQDPPPQDGGTEKEKREALGAEIVRLTRRYSGG
ncbi:MAG: DUF115 domain-containing protein [Treponema sp.]|jgi:uncharacterized Rossmann fold enzyme|nr:DUF115 domain-containing protein [Treponema sp.]